MRIDEILPDLVGGQLTTEKCPSRLDLDLLKRVGGTDFVPLSRMQVAEMFHASMLDNKTRVGFTLDSKSDIQKVRIRFDSSSGHTKGSVTGVGGDYYLNEDAILCYNQPAD